MTPQTSDSDQKTELRMRLIGYRNRIDQDQRQCLDERIRTHLLDYLRERDDRHVAAFYAFRGETDLAPVLETLHGERRSIYLPVVEGKHMSFRRWHPDGAMQANRFGIPEPVEGAECPPECLDLVLMPLVAFSTTGIRLGMGAGYYDRTFDFRIGRPDARPALVGVAYGRQEVDELPAQPWDVPMDAVITDRGVKQFRE